MAFEIGDTAGDYQIVGVLGAGGMGKVYKVRNVISDRIEAMKVLLPNLAEAPELADRFIREIKLLASLSHPNIAALHTALRLENQLLMVMEFVDGRSLDDLLREGPISIWDSVDYMSQALSALSYAHERGVVHRDIKPANMMVTDGQLKLMDFGVAKAVADRKLTMTGTTLGSLYYMSPEQVQGSPTLDGRSDLYSMGIALYELATGKRPFQGDSDYSIMAAQLQQQPVPPIQVDPTLPAALNEIILTAIEKDPANRFQSAQAFRGALESVKQGLVRPSQVRRATAASPEPTPGATRTAGVLSPPPAPQAAPPPFQPVAAPPAPPVQPMWAQPAPPPPPPPARGHRGLYMALGALVAVAVLVVAATQLPRWYRAFAGAGSVQPPAAVEVQQQQPAQAAQPAQEVQPAAVTQPAEQAPFTEPPREAATPSAVAPAAGQTTPAAVRTPATRRLSSGPRQSGGAEQYATPAQPPAAVENAPPAPPPVDTKGLENARERLAMLGARANAVRGSLQNLERQQRADGLGLRTDISASWKRMEFLLDEADAALRRQDLAAARRNLNLADRETDKLENFLGR